jgi:predicted dienelactone hydrolase
MRRLLLSSLLAFAFVGCATAPAVDPDQTPKSRYTGEVGSSPVGVIPEGTIRAGERSLDIAVDYPTRTGAHPLLILSHAFGASPRDYVGLSSFWASQGYVVVRPTHADATRPSSNARSVTDAWENAGAAEWRARAQDITFLIDSLDALEQAYPELVGKIDRTKIGVAGHAYGAVTAMLVGGAKTFPGGTSYADPRVKAVIALSPAGPSPKRGLTEQSFADVRVPALFITGAAEQTANKEENVDWRKQAFVLSPAGDKWLVVLENANQSAFTGRLLPPAIVGDSDVPQNNTEAGPFENPAPPPAEQRPNRREDASGLRIRSAAATVKAITLAFWDAYLRADAEGRTSLEKAGERGGVTLEKK